jgi:hypothetical protein
MDTGNVLDPPSYDRMAVYPVRVEGDDVLVGLPGVVLPTPSGGGAGVGV